MLAAWLLERVGFRQQIDRVRDVAALVVLGALLSMTVSATIGTAALELSSATPLEGFWTAWSAWWAGDAMGILVVAPFLLCVLTWREVEPKLGWRRLPEALALLVLLVTASVFAMWNTGQLLFLIPPLLAWIAWRFQLRGAAPAVLLVSVLAAWAATREMGWFADLSLAQRMLTLQLFNATIAFTAFFLSALVSERMRAESGCSAPPTISTCACGSARPSSSMRTTSWVARSPNGATPRRSSAGASASWPRRRISRGSAGGSGTWDPEPSRGRTTCTASTGTSRGPSR